MKVTKRQLRQIIIEVTAQEKVDSYLNKKVDSYLNRTFTDRPRTTGIDSFLKTIDPDGANIAVPGSDRVRGKLTGYSEGTIKPTSDEDYVALAGDLSYAMKDRGLFGAGTSEYIIGMVFSSLMQDKKALERLKSEYKRLFRRDLMDDIRSELSDSDLLTYVENEFPGAL